MSALLLLAASATLLCPARAPPAPARPPAPLLGAPDARGAPGAQTSDPCLASAGYSWCAATRSCLRQWVTPCPDNFADCKSCLEAQRNGINIACPARCDILTAGGEDPCDCPAVPPCPLMAPAPPGCTVVRAPVDECGCATGCPVVQCGAGQSCGGFAAGVAPSCAPPYECVQTMGPMVADAPGQCRAPCATRRDAYGNCIEPGCAVWYDGCNTCHVAPGSTAMACTEMWCAAPSAARCLDTTDTVGNEGDVCHRFCEDGSEESVHLRCAAGMECVAPAGVGFDSCGARASRCARVAVEVVAVTEGGH